MLNAYDCKALLKGRNAKRGYGVCGSHEKNPSNEVEGVVGLGSFGVVRFTICFLLPDFSTALDFLEGFFGR